MNTPTESQTLAALEAHHAEICAKRKSPKRKSTKPYTPEQLNSAGISHRCNLNVALAKEINKKECELAGMVSVPDDGTISAGEIEMGGKKFDVRYSERNP